MRVCEVWEEHNWKSVGEKSAPSLHQSVPFEVLSFRSTPAPAEKSVWPSTGCWRGFLQSSSTFHS